MKSLNEIKGYICSKCEGKIKGEDIKPIGYTEYEGITVTIFKCPHCEKEIDDLQCDFWIEIDK